MGLRNPAVMHGSVHVVYPVHGPVGPGRGRSEEADQTAPNESQIDALRAGWLQQQNTEAKRTCSGRITTGVGLARNTSQNQVRPAEAAGSGTGVPPASPDLETGEAGRAQSNRPGGDLTWILTEIS